MFFFFKKNIMLQMIQKGGGWSFEFCIFAYISYIYFLIFYLYLFFKLRQASNSCKKVLEAARLAYANKTK